MRNLALVILLLLVAWPAWGAPWLVCDPSPAGEGVTHYDITEGGATVRTPAPLHMDLAGVANGVHNIEVRAVRVDALWGDAVSAPTPFAYTKPASPGAVQNVRVVK